LPGCGGQAPGGVMLPVSDFASYLELGGECEISVNVVVGVCCCAPFSESEQLGSHVRLSAPTSKPISPLSRYAASVRPTGRHALRRAAASERSMSRAASRFATAWRLS
jgi:hypothetical protein